MTKPDRKKIVAEIRYQTERGPWAGLVTNAENRKEGWQVWFQVGTRFKKSGTFVSRTEMVKFLRRVTGKKFRGIVPEIDTLDLLPENRDSLVPACHKKQSDMAENCQGCPYKWDCFGKELGAEFSLLVEKEAKLEEEQTFLQRLKEKVSEKWG